MAGDRGPGAGRTGAGRVRETGEERAGSGREIKKGKLSLFVTTYHPVKETNPATFPRLRAKFYMQEKSKNENLENYKTVIP